MEVVYIITQDRLVKFLSLQTAHSNQFKVMVGIGKQLNCNRMCSNIPLKLTTTIFYRFYVLQLVVLM